MPEQITAGDLRKLMVTAKAQWTIDERLNDNDAVRRHPLGADLTRAEKVSDVPRIDIAPFLKTPSSNPFLQQLRINRGFLEASERPISPAVRDAIEKLAIEPAMENGAGAAMVNGGSGSNGHESAVDWRNRFGWPWLTKVKDQDPCESCWTFSAVGVVEAMTRIEHAVWSLRSEGDVHDGMNAQCATTGWPTHAFDWMKSNGVADPGSWAYETTNQKYAPTPDRAGRTVRLDSYVTLSNVNDQKVWLDNVGPLSACFTVYNDFFAYGPNSGVYTQTSQAVAGGHCIVVVGYDDAKQAWLIRNSWGTGWGMQGYCWFGYGQCDIDNNAKYGVPGANTSPDPWTKRRIHSGNIFESGDGQIHRNFEVWAHAPGNAVRHYWRNGANLNWAVAESQGNDCAGNPCATGTTYNRNFEFIYRTTANRLHHRFFDQGHGAWMDGPVFGPTNVAGDPGFIQSDYGSPGNFEVVVLLSTGQLAHWWRNEGNFAWQQSAVFGQGVAFSGPALVQRFDRGLDVICTNRNGTMQRYLRDDAHGKPWQACETFGSGITSAPVMIEGQFGATDENSPGNYELCVAAGGQIEHWWRTVQGANTWANSAKFGSSHGRVVQVLGLIESSFGFDLELVALLDNGSLQHFWRSDKWYEGPVFGSTNH